eukprot:CAMPEP_0114253804 /NCGR_PEP_ID=MMETSP0058-20121206/16613_1 /TAXON_ID=36894 /ORGANISM="Pyramimonas parkeae, CCMP726" /LENGTH=309 /DNA_ID=CAMNT_0001367925 /DNA_START=301 /DNA_END=1230 /DNA_ORIENTATION=+
MGFGFNIGKLPSTNTPLRIFARRGFRLYWLLPVVALAPFVIFHQRPQHLHTQQHPRALSDTDTEWLGEALDSAPFMRDGWAGPIPPPPQTPPEDQTQVVRGTFAHPFKLKTIGQMVRAALREPDPFERGLALAELTGDAIDTRDLLCESSKPHERRSVVPCRRLVTQMLHDMKMSANRPGAEGEALLAKFPSLLAQKPRRHRPPEPHNSTELPQESGPDQVDASSRLLQLPSAKILGNMNLATMEEQDDFRGSEDLGTNRLFKDNGSNVEKSRSLIMQTNQNMLMQSSRVVEDTSLEGVDRERAFKMPS